MTKTKNLEDILKSQTILEIHKKEFKNAAIVYVNSLFNQITKTEELKIKIKLAKSLSREDFEEFEKKLNKKEGFIDGITYNYIVELVEDKLKSKEKIINWDKLSTEFWELLPHVHKAATILGGYKMILKNINKAQTNATNNSISLIYFNNKNRPKQFNNINKNIAIFEYYFQEEYINLFKKYNIPEQKIEQIKERNYVQTKSFLKIFPKITESLLNKGIEEGKVIFEEKIKNKYYIGINYNTNKIHKLKSILNKLKYSFNPNSIKKVIDIFKENIKKDYEEQTNLLNETNLMIDKYREQVTFFTSNFDLITNESNYIIPKNIITELVEYHKTIKLEYDQFIESIDLKNYEIKDFMMIHLERDKIKEIYDETKQNIDTLNEKIKNQDEFILDKIVEIHKGLDKESKKNYIDHLIKLIDIKYGLEGHSKRVSKIVEQMAIEYNKTAKLKLDVKEYKIAAGLHDIGKFWIPESILDYTRSNLTDMEYKFIRNHPKIGYNLLKKLGFKELYCDAAGYHHEKMNGKGYPFQVEKKEIPRIALFIMFADTFDSMMTRGYVQKKHNGEKINIEYIFNEVDKMKGYQFAEEYIDIFKQAMTSKSFNQKSLYEKLYIKEDNNVIDFDIGLQKYNEKKKKVTINK